MSLQFTLGRAAAQPIGQPDVMSRKVDQHAVDRTPLVEQVEYQPDDGLHLLVGIERDLARRAAARSRAAG